VCTVGYEPVSTEYSLLSGNLTGNFAIFRPWRQFYIREAAVPQRFFTKFPKKINRVKLSDNRDRNRINSEIQSGYLDISRRPFLTHFLSPPAAAAICSHRQSCR
jgi:hypothetical protein